MAKRLKCRFCAWTTRKLAREPNTEKAFGRLREHIKDVHYDEQDALIDLVAENQDAEVEQMFKDQGDPERRKF